jgi:hypothetical protein
MIKPTSIAIAMLLTASTLAAQVGTGRYGPAKTPAAGKRGVQQPAPSQPTPVVQPNGSRPSTHTPDPAAVPVALKLVPAVLMSDGSILADFGFGLERVRRPCSSAVVRPSRVLGGNGQVLSQAAPGLQPVPQMQPAPGMQPAPQMQPAPGQPMSQRQLSEAALASCFTRDANGRVFVTQ